MTIFKWTWHNLYIKHELDSQIRANPGVFELTLSDVMYQELLTIVDDMSRLSGYIVYRNEKGKYYLVKRSST